MRSATAQATREICFNRPNNAFAFEWHRVEEGEELDAGELLPSDNMLNRIQGPTLIAAEWMPIVEQRILDSVPTQIVGDDEGWLDSEIALHAIGFLQATSDVLPADDPYLYTSIDGDLVAEFSGRHGKLTSVIGKTAASTFAVIDGNILKTIVSLPFENVLTVRKEFQRMTHLLRDGAHGIVEA